MTHHIVIGALAAGLTIAAYVTDTNQGGWVRMNWNDIKAYGCIIWLALAACAVPVWAITQQYRTFTLTRAAEDDCPPIYGAWALDTVEAVETGPFKRVRCSYR